MKISFKHSIRVSVTLILICSGFAFVAPDRKARFPYKQAGLNERQAAAHLLYRFTFGPTPGQVDAVVKRGLENWFQDQLNARLPDDTLNNRLTPYSALNLGSEEITQKFPKLGEITKMAAKDGAINLDSFKIDRAKGRKKLDAYMKQNGLKSDAALVHELTYQKVLRAVYSNNQLKEVMTDFWFNHFNVSFTKTICANYIPVYEREAIRPNALGDFETLLTATAKSGAMLVYLDNFQSTGPDLHPEVKHGKGAKDPKGLNENYAREIMELHTLGVDGGYNQQDVTEAARVLTGWTIFPANVNNGIRKMFEKQGEANMRDKGFVHEGDFLFVPEHHDNGIKTVLGKKFEGGYQEGVQFLKLLAHHPSTSKFICRKLAVRFVSDDPPAALVDKMAKVFLSSGGDIKKVLLAMVTSNEFWGHGTLREKTKSPFELMVSSLRILHASVDDPSITASRISQMGQRLYSFAAPTGFPDKGAYWINTGSLLNRMNFGLALAAGRIKGVHVNLLALNDNHEPGSADEALLTYTKRLLPERTTDATVQRLTPLLSQENLQKKLKRVAGDTVSVDMPDKSSRMEDPMGDSTMVQAVAEPPAESAPVVQQPHLSQIVGIIIGSPEFQRR